MEAVKEVPTITLQEKVFSCSCPKEKYKLLTGLSEQAKELIEQGEVEAETVNEVLLMMYSNEEHTEFNTFMQWKEKGFKVKKGSKSFFVWSKPKAIKKKKEEGKQAEKEEETEGKKIFRMAHLFSNSQVEPIESK